MKTIFGAFSVCASLMLASAAAAPAAPAVSKAAGLVCPVTFLPISSPAAAVGKSVYKKKTYYFCTSNCKRLFDKNPSKYVKHS